MSNINGGYISFGGGGSGGSGSNSGIQSINNEVGPDISFYGESGIYVRTAANTIIIGSSGTSSGSVNKFASNFINMTSGQFAHSLGTRDVVVSVYDNGTINRPPYEIMPDEIILDNLDSLSLKFNSPTSGRVVILG